MLALILKWPTPINTTLQIHVRKLYPIKYSSLNFTGYDKISLVGVKQFIWSFYTPFLCAPAMRDLTSDIIHVVFDWLRYFVAWIRLRNDSIIILPLKTPFHSHPYCIRVNYRVRNLSIYLFFDFNDHFDFYRDVSGQHIHAHRRSGVFPLIAENIYQQVGRTVDHLGLIRKVGRTVDHTE